MAEHMTGFALDWDTVIDTDGSEYILLPEGDYDFTVTAFERKQFPGSTKIPPCKKAELTLSVQTPEGQATCKYDLILYSSLMWRIAEFFRAIGQKKHGQAFTPNWGAVVGSTGRARFKPRSYTAKDGAERQANDVDKFYDKEEAASLAQMAAPAQGAAPVWNGGKF